MRCGIGRFQQLASAMAIKMASHFNKTRLMLLPLPPFDAMNKIPASSSIPGGMF